jgi:hypothetical protein
MCIRRTSRVLGTLQPTFILRKLRLSATEIRQYGQITDDCKRTMAIAISTKKGYEARHTILQTFQKLRLFCNNGHLNTKRYDSDILPKDPDEALFLQQQDKAKCAYCDCGIYVISGPKDSNSASLTECNNLVCDTCQPRHLSERKKARSTGLKCCHLCYMKGSGSSSPNEFFTVDMPTNTEDKINGSTNEAPTKLKALLEDIIEYRQAGKR